MRGALVAAILVTGCGRFGFGGDDAPGDAAAIDAPGDVASDIALDAPSCLPPVDQMDETFSAATIDVSKWIVGTDPNVTIGVVGGTLRMALADNAAGSHYGTLRSRCAYDLRGHELSVRIAGRPRSDPSAEMALCFIHYDMAPSYHQVCIDVIAGQLLAVVNNDNNVMTMAQRALDPVNDQYWRLREQGGTVFMHTSADGMTWAPFFSLATPIDLSQAHLLLLAGTYMAVATPGAAEYDDLLAQ